MDNVVLMVGILGLCFISGSVGRKSETVEIVDGCVRLKNHIEVIEPPSKEQIPNSKTVHVNDSVRVILSRNHLKYKRDEQYYCKVAFKTHETGYRILLSWEYFTVGERRNSHDWLQVVDLQSGLPLSDEMWGVMGQGTSVARPPPTNDYHSIGHGLVLNYKGHPYDDALAVILTVFRDLDAENECNDGYFKCFGNFMICIRDTLRCNGDNNCGDSNRSDEDASCHSNPWITENTEPPISKSSTPVGLIGALSGIFLTGILIATVGCLVCLYKRRRRRLRSEMSNHQPRSIDSLAQNGRVPVCNNTYTQLPTGNLNRACAADSDHHVMDFSQASDVSPITLDGDSNESLLRSDREGVTFNTVAPGQQPTVRFSSSNGPSNGAPSGGGAGCGATGGNTTGPDGQIYYYMDDICPEYQHVS